MTEEKTTKETTTAAPAARPEGPSAAPTGARPPFQKRRQEFRRKVCRLCADHIDHVDYKNTQFLKTFVMEGGKILSRRITGTCAKHQRQICTAVKRNRNLALLPYCVK